MSGESTGADVEALVAWLVEQGGSPGSSLHSWRCEHPDRYGECDCLAESARDLLASDWLAARDAATAERVRRETAEGIADALERQKGIAEASRDIIETPLPKNNLGQQAWAYGDAARIAREQAR